MSNIGNWVSENSNTVGTGVINLTGSVSSDLARFSDAMPSGQVFYSIEDGSNREAGIATFNGSSSLTRITVHASLLNGVYNNVNPQPLNLSGNAIVSSTFNATAFHSLSDHLSDTDNPHLTSWTNLLGIPATFPPDPHVHTALEVSIDDTIMQTGITVLQPLLEFLDDQIGLRETAASGVVEGGVVSIASATTIDITSGDGEIVDAYTDRRNPTRTNILWSAIAGYTINMPNQNGTQVIYFDNLGAIQQKPAPFSPVERRVSIQVAFVQYEAGAISSVSQAGILSNEVGNTLYDWIYFTDADNRASGMGIKPVTNVLSIWGDSGELFSPGINIDVSITNQNIKTFAAVGDINTPVSFDVMFADGTVESVAATIIPDYYESSPGNTSNLPGNNAAIHYVYRTIDNKVILQLGTTEYGNAQQARDQLQVDRSNYIPFIGSDSALLSAQIYVEGNAPDFNDPNDAAIVSTIIGSGTSSSISISNFLDLTDVLESTYTGNGSLIVRVDAAETGLEFTVLSIIEDTSPQLGGELETQNNSIVFQDAGGVEVGRAGSGVSDNGVAIGHTSLGVYDPNDGGIGMTAGTVEIGGGVCQINTLANPTIQQVFSNADGSLYGVEPPPPDFTVSDTDNGNYPLPTLGVWVQLTGLSVTIPQAVAVGEPLRMDTNIHIINGSGNRGGTIAIGMGINGAAPVGAGIIKNVSGGMDNIVPVSLTNTTHGGLAINDTIEVWAQRDTEEHNQFAPSADATSAPLHEMFVSSATGGGSAPTDIGKGAQAVMLANFDMGAAPAPTAIPWDGVDIFDDLSFHNPAVNNTRFTIPPGISRIEVNVRIALGANIAIDSFESLRISKNGVNINGSIVDHYEPVEHASSSYGFFLSYPVEVVDTDYIEVIFDTDIANKLILFTNSYASIKVLQ